ncbi:MAG: bifunctional 3-hydroxyacyl-CoA dehydrogenase/thioesterase [Ilumatobacteraceae bacterium]|nr:bifunctional 3-hydroxyacyl-CoA dehydrogenase/thioesterase [Ilumatobacteraceae bacterium]
MSPIPGLQRVGLLGGGVIGGGWAARFLLNGVDVLLYDPDPEAPRKVGEIIAGARRAYSKLTMAPWPAEGTLTFVSTPEAAVVGVDFVQESAPERLDLKRKILGAASAAADPGVVFGSSTSGLLPTEIQQGMTHPERLVVGHPFNPVYMLPLVEICGGNATSEATKARAAEVYSSIGMRPLVLRKEIDGFVADRLLEALWREALWLVNDGIATTEQIDDAVRFGAGLRWSFMGTFLVYRIAGGEAGMRHFMAQFGPSLKWPWTKLMDVPELDDVLLEKIVGQSDDQANGVGIRELEALRDDCLVAVMQGLRAVDDGAGYGAGTVLAQYEKALFDRAAVPAVVDDSAAEVAGPLRTHSTRIPTDWVDYNGHTNDSRYAQLSCDAADAFLRLIGMDAAYLRGGHSWFTAESHISYLAQSKAGDAVHVTTQVLHHDAKRLHVFNRMYLTGRDGADDTLMATGEHMYLHVDTEIGKSVPAPQNMQDRIVAIADRQAGLDRPPQAGRYVGAPRS